MQRSDNNYCNAAEGADSPHHDGASVVSSPCDAPDWSLVHFDVPCARCGHDLRWRSEPKCPACQLEFDWSDAVPLEKITCAKCDYHLYGLSEARCPECGESFDWDEALLNYRRSQKPLFEYRWRKEPIRSLIRTWWMALRPGKFWRAVDIHDPPRVRPLVGLLGIALLCLFALLPVGAGVTLMVVEWTWRTSARRMFSNFFAAAIDLLGSWELYTLLLGVALWYSAGVAALLLLRQSMRLCKVRSAHVVRVCAYALGTVPLWIVGSNFVLLCGVIVLQPQLGVNVLDAMSFVFPTVMVVWLAHGTWSIRAGYKHYIRMRHAFLVAFLSQLIAGLATMLVFVLISLAANDW